MFRNLTFFRFPASVADKIREMAARDPRHDAGADREAYSLQAALSESAEKPCGPLELSSRGWVSPYGQGFDALFAQVGSCLLLTLGGEDKILPSAAVNAAVAKRVAEIEQRDGRNIGGRARKALRDDIVHDLLPRALVKPYRLNGYIDLNRGIVAVDTCSRKAAEGFVSYIRHSLGSFPALPINAEAVPRVILTDWIIGASPEHGNLTVDDSATLQDPSDAGGIVKLDRLELGEEEIGAHLECGMTCTRLGLTLEDRLTFTFDEDLAVRKLKFLDGAMDKLESFDRDGQSSEIDARFALLCGEVGDLFDVLEKSFNFSTAEG